MYASVYSPHAFAGALGVADCPCPACAAPKRAACTGAERADNCPGSVCCPPSTFTNQTYGITKGWTSLQYLNERRVRHALNFLLSVEPQAESTPPEELAYDTKLPPPTALMSRIRSAAAAYHLLFPGWRWYNDKKCRRTDCQSDGFYSCYRYNMPSGKAQRLAEVKKLSGSQLTAKQYTGVPYSQVDRAGKKKNVMGDERWPQLPSGYKAWVSSALGVIASIPGGEMNTHRARMSNYGEWANAWERSREIFLTVVNGRMVPSGWLASFLDVFAPARAIRLTSGFLRRVNIIRLPGPAPTIKHVVPLPRPEDEAGAGAPASRKAPLLIAGAVLLAGGAAFLLMRRRGRK